MANNNENKILNVPNLRFPEFSGKWKKCTLGDITINFNLRNKEKIELPMYSVTNNRGFIPQSEQFEDRDMVGEDIKAYKIIHNKDFAYNPARINVGSIAKYNGSKPCMISSLYVCFKAANGIDEDWLMHLLRSPKIQYYYNINGEGGVRIYLFYPNFARIRTSFPTIAEQRKIANLLSLLDARITTQNKIIEDLKKLKSAIYQNLFFHLQGDKVPLSELAEIIKGQQINGSELSENGKYYVMNGGITPSGYYDNYNTEADTISISEGGNSCGYVQYNSSDFWSGGHCYTLRIKPTALISTPFLFHFLKWKEPDIMALRSGSGLPNIQKKDLSKVCIIVPTLDEQQQLIALLSTFQMKIENEEIFTFNLNKQKQHLLSQMFI